MRAGIQGNRTFGQRHRADVSHSIERSIIDFSTAYNDTYTTRQHHQINIQQIIRRTALTQARDHLRTNPLFSQYRNPTSSTTSYSQRNPITQCRQQTHPTSITHTSDNQAVSLSSYLLPQREEHHRTLSRALSINANASASWATSVLKLLPYPPA